MAREITGDSTWDWLWLRSPLWLKVIIVSLSIIFFIPIMILTLAMFLACKDD